MSRKISWGILGNARIARTQVIPAIQRSTNGVVSAIASRGSAPEQAAQELGISGAHAGYEGLLADPEIDAVYIPVPNSEHVEWVIRAAEAGKHVLCEKPLALSYGDWERARQACESSGVLLLEAFMYRFHPQHERVRELIASGVIGAVSAIHANFHFDIGELDGPNVRLHGDLGGGSLNDVGCYAIDATTALMGAAPERVFASARYAPHDGRVDVTTAGVMDFGPVRTTFDCGFQGTGDTYTVVGNLGRIEVTHAFRPDVRGDVGSVIVHSADRVEEHVIVADQYRLQVEAFADAVRGATDLAPYTAQSDITVRTLDALRESLETGEPAAVNN